MFLKWFCQHMKALSIMIFCTNVIKLQMHNTAICAVGEHECVHMKIPK